MDVLAMQQVIRVVLLALALLSIGCSGIVVGPTSDLSKVPLEQLIGTVNGCAGPLRLHTIRELGERGAAAAPAAPALGRALRCPYRNSCIAGRALMRIGPAGEAAIPELLVCLESERADVRKFAAKALGFIGEPAECTVPRVAQLLWDDDGTVRTAAAACLEMITGVDLVDKFVLPGPDDSGTLYDEPEGDISGKARSWWIGEGQYQEWDRENDLCQE